MITPNDIQTKQFSKVVRGYKTEEVDEYLDLLTVDFERLIFENNNLKKQLENSKQETEAIKNEHGSIVNVMAQAKLLMEEISAGAEKRAELIIKNAQTEAGTILDSAKQEAVRLEENNRALKNYYSYFKEKYKNLLEDELNRLKTESNDIFSENLDKLDEILNDKEVNGNVSAHAQKEENRKTMIVNSDEFPG